MKNLQSFALALTFTLPLTVYAADPASMNPCGMSQSGSGQSGMGAMGTGMTETMAPDNMQGGGNMPGMAGMSQGVIRKVDISGKKITIRHGPLANLGMPAMTMVFKVKDPALLDQVKAGDKVNFVAESINGVLTVTTVEAAK